MKRYLIVLLAVVLFVSCQKKSGEAIVEEAMVTEEALTDTAKKIIVRNEDGKFMFELGPVKHTLTFNPPKELLWFDPDDETVELIVYETSTGEDFISLDTKSHGLGIRSERVWIGQTYPEFTETKQMLMDIDINGNIYPCDVLVIENESTGETKYVYFEIESFFYNRVERDRAQQ